jgi:hypothetical protein
MTMLGRGDAQELEITLASHGFFNLTGAHAAIGRTFAADEDRAGGNSRVIVLSQDDAPFADWRAVTGAFFKTMGLAMMRGRTFTTAEDLEGGPVVIVSETLARQ